ncbi:DUF721 domain-containing protein [Sphingomonas sp. HDW15A]|uniref:DUF721 domain-containing protein n=1 Tax=Sphingomonas sp. HDW15A TaxID=2714942 RepID=UPI0014075589|nr:DciA family protein [Sphingomonas sp. HDW15A]QIK96694.1 DUF721 domain-containing protein [Sphingomonas sp. HDW15A]
MAKPRDKKYDSPRQGRVRPAGELIGEVGGLAFKRFGFVQGAVVSRWGEIVGERYAGVSLPESIRFPSGSRKNGTLTLLVQGAHAPLMQHLGPMIIERVNRFFGYEAINKVAYRQGVIPAKAERPERQAPAPVPTELGEGLRTIADPELRACLESLAGQIAASSGPPAVDKNDPKPLPIIRSIT